jgi:hypothetical protein
MESVSHLMCHMCLNNFMSYDDFDRHLRFCIQPIDDMSFIGPHSNSLRRENGRFGPSSASSNLNDTMIEVINKIILYFHYFIKFTLE